MTEYLDKQEIEIVRELIKNPRLSDNRVSKNTNIPLKTVNRKRKKLEEAGLLQYFTYLDTSANGTEDFQSRQLYIITFNYGITRKHFLDAFRIMKIDKLFPKHILESHLGENNGRLLLILIVESREDSDIIEIFNSDINSLITQYLGDNAIFDVTTIKITNMLQLLHNYFPKRNIKKGLYQHQLNDSQLFVVDNVKENKK